MIDIGVRTSVSLDYNDEIRGGHKFDKIKTLHNEWEDYIGTLLEETGIPQSEMEDSSADSDAEGVRSKQKKARKAREDPVKAVIDEDGSIWIGDIDGLAREALQARVRGFFTAHYREYRHYRRL